MIKPHLCQRRADVGHRRRIPFLCDLCGSAPGCGCDNETVSCAICHERKEKRFCPAVHDRICPICCGTEREVTLDCPSECPYLQQARKHETAARLEEIDREALMPQVEVPETFLYEREPLMGGHCA